MTTTDEKAFFNDLDETLNIYTDGSCIGNPGPGGWGCVFVKSSGEVFSYSGGEASTTNNRMEMLAAISALLIITEKTSLKHIVIHTDSRYLKDGITSWITKWKKNKWMTANKTPVKNQELWEILDHLIQKIHVEWQWVKAHNGHQYNEMADALALNGAIKYQVKR